MCSRFVPLTLPSPDFSIPTACIHPSLLSFFFSRTDFSYVHAFPHLEALSPAPSFSHAYPWCGQQWKLGLGCHRPIPSATVRVCHPPPNKFLQLSSVSVILHPTGYGSPPSPPVTKCRGASPCLYHRPGATSLRGRCNTPV
jgi:hypothetical protein